MGQEELGRPLDAGREIALLLGEVGLQQEAVKAQDAVDRGPDLMRYLHTPGSRVRDDDEDDDDDGYGLRAVTSTYHAQKGVLV